MMFLDFTSVQISIAGGVFAMTANAQGLAMWWSLKIVRPEPQPNKNTKDETNKQKLSHHIAKPPDGCCLAS